MKKEKGFTLIELLVVIAVIGILAGVVLVNLQGARDRARDARVVSGVGQARAIAEVVFARTGNYAALCASATSLGTTDGLNLIQADITENGGIVACHAAGSTYCISARLNDLTFQCVDSDGRSIRRTAAQGVGCSATTLPTTRCAIP